MGAAGARSCTDVRRRVSPLVRRSASGGRGHPSSARPRQGPTSSWTAHASQAGVRRARTSRRSTALKGGGVLRRRGFVARRRAPGGDALPRTSFADRLRPAARPRRRDPARPRQLRVGHASPAVAADRAARTRAARATRSLFIGLAGGISVGHDGGALVTPRERPLPSDRTDADGIRLWVVVPAWNEAPGIGATMAALADQRDRDFALVVVDNGSTDGTDRRSRASLRRNGTRGHGDRGASQGHRSGSRHRGAPRHRPRRDPRAAHGR